MCVRLAQLATRRSQYVGSLSRTLPFALVYRKRGDKRRRLEVAVTDEAAYGALSSRWVSFLGPPLTRQARGSLSVANITMIDRRRSEGWDGQVLDYVVSVNAHDDEDAAARVRTALQAHGSFSAFAPTER